MVYTTTDGAVTVKVRTIRDKKIVAEQPITASVSDPTLAARISEKVVAMAQAQK